MICHACSTNNPDDAHFCSHCGVRIVQHTGPNAEIAELIAATDDTPTAPAPPSVPEPPTPSPSAPSHSDQHGYPTAKPPAFGEPDVASQPAAPSPSADPTAVFSPGPPAGGPPADPAPGSEPLLADTARSSVVPILAVIAVLIVVVGAGAFLLFAGGDDGDDAIATPTDTAAVTDPPTTGAGDDPPVTTPPPAPGGTRTAAVATPVVHTTPPAPTSPPTSPPAPPTTLAPEPAPEPPAPVDAPGSPQVLAEVQPSGLGFAEVEPEFLLAQEFGDALALEDWPLARQLSPELADNTDDDFVRGYGNTNRVSLVLLDARFAGPTTDLLVASVAVENGGAQTSLFCLDWAVDPVAMTVDQRGGQRLATLDGNVTPEAVVTDPDLLVMLASCAFT